MKKGTTKSGFKFVIEDGVFDDMELLEALADVDKGNSAALPDVIVRVLGEDQKKKLYDHLRDQNGRVPVSKVGAELAEIFGAFDETKKS